MSRSLGDRIAHSVGVSCEPEIHEHQITDQDKILLIASDGVWEFLSNEDVRDIVAPYYIKGAPEAAANAVVKAAFNKWKEEDDVVDDITVVVIFLDLKESNN